MKFSAKRHLIIGLLLLATAGTLIQCNMPLANTSIYYTDQNNNTFSISANSLEYNPILAEESSSGTYDGGEPATVSLSKEQFEAIRNGAVTLLEDTSKHSEKRQMMTAVLQLKTTDSSTRKILVKSSERAAFEALLIDAIDTE